MTTPLALRAQWAWRMTVCLQFAVLSALAVDHFLLRTHSYWPVWLLQTLPLLAVMPGLLAQRARSGIWLCFLLLFYFLSFVEKTALDSQHRIAYLGLVVLVMALFTTSLCFVRWQRMSDAITETRFSPLN